MDNEYGTMFKRLMNEHNELRKYIIDICELLDINTSQSVLGANCLEFYAVLYSTAENKIGDLQEQLKRKEQECEELHSRTASIIYNLTGGRLSYSTYTLEGCADAYHDQLKMDVERATKELEEENETLKQEVNTLEQALDEIRQYRVCEINDVDGEEDDVILGIIDEVMEP